MSLYKKKRLAFITIVYWFLLIYIIAALVWWFISLETQNNQMYNYRLSQLKKDDITYQRKTTELEDIKRRKTSQYVGEGVIFLLVILVGAVFVYRAARRQIFLSHQQQNFMMAVTHELKTPIAITQLNLETLQKRKLEENQQQKLIANTIQEANRLNALTNNILVASQLETGSYNLNMQELDLSELANSCSDDFTKRFTNRKFEKKIEIDVYVEGEKMLLQMLVNNLLDNALKYSEKNSATKILLSKEANKVKLSVVDEGYGIPDEEKKKVFDKFYRVGNEEVRTTKGTGLGLYLCRKIVKDHHGTITISNNHPHGSIFTVFLQSI